MIATVGLIGDPVKHSVSPALHAAAFAYHGLPDIYVLWPTPAAELAARVESLRESGMRGANVTIPHKTAVIPLLEQLDPMAQAVGAVNTIVRRDNGELYGLNTDVEGFLRSLAEVGFTPRGQSVVMLGAGGAARAVGYGLIAAGVESLVVANRTLERAEALLADLLATTDLDPSLHVLAIDDPRLIDHLAEAEAIINATSVGLDGESLPLPAELISSRHLVIDLIYRQTPLLQAAAARGARTQDGLEMLVQQGALAFEAWTGLPAPVDAMRSAARRAIEG